MQLSSIFFQESSAIILTSSIFTLLTPQRLNVCIREKVNDIKYSPDGKFVAICSGRSIKIFEAPDISKSIEPMLLFKKYNGAHNDDIKLINWSLDSRLLLSCSKDNTVRIFTLFHIKDYAPICLTGHKASIVYAFADEEFAHVRFSISLSEYNAMNDSCIHLPRTVCSCSGNGWMTMSVRATSRCKNIRSSNQVCKAWSILKLAFVYRKES